MGNIVADLAEGGAKGLFSGIGQMAKDIRTAITGKDPAKEAEVMQKLLELEFTAQKAQADINLTEAQNPNLFVSGWRPAVGWICVTALGVSYIIFPLVSWIAQMFHATLTGPKFNGEELMALLSGLLGLGGLRTYEKVQGVSQK